MIRLIGVITLTLLLTACGSTSGVPAGSVAWCGQFDYTGTVTKSETSGRALGVSDAALVERMSVDDVIKLAEVMGCSRD